MRESYRRTMTGQHRLAGFHPPGLLDSTRSTSNFSYPAAEGLELQACDRLFILPFVHRQEIHRGRDRRGSDPVRRRTSSREPPDKMSDDEQDRKSTRLNSSH